MEARLLSRRDRAVLEESASVSALHVADVKQSRPRKEVLKQALMAAQVVAVLLDAPSSNDKSKTDFLYFITKCCQTIGKLENPELRQLRCI